MSKKQATPKKKSAAKPVKKSAAKPVKKAVKKPATAKASKPSRVVKQAKKPARLSKAAKPAPKPSKPSKPAQKPAKALPVDDTQRLAEVKLATSKANRIPAAVRPNPDSAAPAAPPTPRTELTAVERQSLAKTLEGTSRNVYEAANTLFGVKVGDEIFDMLAAGQELFKCCECGVWKGASDRSNLNEKLVEDMCEECRREIDGECLPESPEEEQDDFGDAGSDDADE